MPISTLASLTSNISSCALPKKRTLCDEYIVGATYSDADMNKCFTQPTGSTRWALKTNYAGVYTSSNYQTNSTAVDQVMTNVNPFVGAAVNSVRPSCGQRYAVYKECV